MGAGPLFPRLHPFWAPATLLSLKGLLRSRVEPAAGAGIVAAPGYSRASRQARGAFGAIALYKCANFIAGSPVRG